MSKTERQLLAQDREGRRKSIHEQGGLTPEAWGTVLKLNDESISGSVVTQKVVDYAKWAIENPQADQHFAHREYLGTKDWQSVLDLFPDKKIALHKLTGRYTRDSKLQSPSPDDIALYALFEQHKAYSIDDYEDRLKKRFSHEGDGPYLWTGTKWEQRRPKPEDKTSLLLRDRWTPISSGTIIRNLRHFFHVPEGTKINLSTSIKELNTILRAEAEKDPAKISEYLTTWEKDSNPWRPVEIPITGFTFGLQEYEIAKIQALYGDHFEGVVPSIDYSQETRTKEKSLFVGADVYEFNNNYPKAERDRRRRLDFFHAPYITRHPIEQPLLLKDVPKK